MLAQRMNHHRLKRTRNKRWLNNNYQSHIRLHRNSRCAKWHELSYRLRCKAIESIAQNDARMDRLDVLKPTLRHNLA